VFTWPSDGVLRIPGVFSSAKLLKDMGPLNVRSDGDTTVVNASGVTPDAIDTVIMLT
jgi:hypothetical protein